VRGDRAHREYGGADATALPPAAGVPCERWDAEFARARASGSAALGDLLQMFWRTQDPARMRVAFDAASAQPDFDAMKRLFLHPVDEIEWELAWLEGAPLPPLPARPGSRLADAYARYAAACVDLAEGRLDAARRRFTSEDRIDDGPWGRCLQQTLAAWALLMERDWRAAEREATLARVRKRFQEPRTKPLRWVFAHPGATLDELRAGLELEPCRVAWMGVCPILFRMVGGEEFARIVSLEHDRLERIAKERGFRVVVLTYLADDVAYMNEQLRTVAAEKRWSLADVHARLALPDLYADDRRTYFSPDRCHPNEAGYALEARAVFDALRAAH